MAKSARIHLVEQSPVLREAQRAKLGADALWHSDLGSLPADGPLLIVANEFFDCLPVRQQVMTAQGLKERFVGLAPGGGEFFYVDETAKPFGREDMARARIREYSPLSSIVGPLIIFRSAERPDDHVIPDRSPRCVRVP